MVPLVNHPVGTVGPVGRYRPVRAGADDQDLVIRPFQGEEDGVPLPHGEQAAVTISEVTDLQPVERGRQPRHVDRTDHGLGRLRRTRRGKLDPHPGLLPIRDRFPATGLTSPFRPPRHSRTPRFAEYPHADRAWTCRFTLSGRTYLGVSECYAPNRWVTRPSA